MWTLAGTLLLVLLLGGLARLHRLQVDKLTGDAALSESFLDASAAALLILDEKGTIIRANKAATRLFRYPAGQLIDRPYSCLIQSPPEEADPTRAAVDAALASSGKCTLQGHRADDTWVSLEFFARNLERDGRAWTVAHFRDLTAENRVKATLNRNLQQLLLTKESLLKHNVNLETVVEERTGQLRIAKDAADRANSAKSDFLAKMSHELRTPLHAVLSFARFGVQRYESAERQKLLTYFQRIETTGQALLSMLNDLLDLSKLEAGVMTLEMEPVEISGVVLEVADEFSALVREKGLSLSVSTPGAQAQVWGDREKLAQVVRNLIANAAKFTPEEGNIRATWNVIGDQVQIDIHDSGPGIPETERQTIFEKFVQSRSTKKVAGGTGLGLTICRQLVSLHNGTITAEPSPDGGALMRVRLPLWTPGEAARSANTNELMATSTTG